MADVLILIVGLLLAISVVIWLLSRRQRWTRSMDISRLHGTARIIEALAILEALNKRRDQGLLCRFWVDAESLLADVAPDHTNDTRKQFIDALTEAHGYCRDRDVAKSLMAMRNAVHEGAPL